MSKGRRRVLIALVIVAALGAIGALTYDHAARGWDDELACARAELAAAAVAPVTSGRDGSMALEAALSQLQELPPDQGKSIFHEVNRLFAPDDWERALAEVPQADRERAIAEHDQHLDQALRALDRAFPLIDQALFRYDFWRFGPPRRDGPAYPQWQRLRALVDLLSARMARSVRLGREEEAWDDAERVLRLAATVEDPYLLPLFMREQNLAIACVRIETLLARVRITDPARRARLVAELARVEGPPAATARAVANDIAAVLDAYGPDDAGADAFVKIFDPEIDASADQRQFLRFPRPLQRAVFRRDRARCATLMAAGVAAAELPWPEVTPRMGELATRFRELSPTWAPLTCWAGSTTNLSPQVVADERATLALLRLARLALAATAGSELPAKPLDLEDPFSPGHSLAWQVKDPRRATASSVGYDGHQITFEVAIPPGQ
jgi:hypothetical protein